MSLMRCECCDKVVDTDCDPMGEDGMCEGCEDAAIAEAYANYKPLYDAEKRQKDAYKAMGYDIDNAVDLARLLKDAGR